MISTGNKQAVWIVNEFSEYTKAEEYDKYIPPPMEFFNLYSKTILRWLETLPGFIISGYNSNIQYTECYCGGSRFRRKTERMKRQYNQGKQLGINVVSEYM